jgi:hypothetical protein
MNGMMKSFGLVCALTAASVLAACGSAPPPVETPPTPTATPEATATPATPPASTSSAATPPPASTGSAPSPSAPPAASMPATNTPLQPSKLIAAVKEAGIDLNKPPKFDKIPDGTKKKLMKSFVTALGYSGCNGCHQGDATGAVADYKVSTRNMKIAKKMWDEFVVAHRDEKKGAIFCDTCHVGNAKILNRADKKAVSEFMDSNYKDRLKLANKKDNDCATCHGDSMETHIIEKIWGIPKG